MYLSKIKHWNQVIINLTLFFTSLSSKAGKYRHIVRSGFVIPIYQKNDFLIHVTIIGGKYEKFKV